MIKIAKLSLVFFAGIIAVVLYLGLLTAMTASADATDIASTAAPAAPPAAPLLVSGGADNFGYTYQDEGELLFGPSYVFTDISGTGTLLDLTDEGWDDITLPFNFSFYGTSSSTFRVSNNGAVIFDPGLEDKVGYLNACPIAHTAKIIAPWWDDWGSAGNIHWQVFGSTPNRYAIIQWTDMIHFPGPAGGDAVTFQLLLYETSNVILFQYQDTQSEGGSHDDGQTGTIGIGGATAGNSLQYGCDTDNILHSGGAIRFQRSSVTVSKVAADSAGLTFTFTVTGTAASGSFSLADGGSTLTHTVPGTYTITESSTPPEWGLGELSCNSSLEDAGFGGDISQFSTDVSARTAAISRLAPGDHVTCVFTNVNAGRVVVDKVTLPAADPTDFSFVLSGGPASLSQPFVLSDTAAPYISTPLLPGTYSLTETLALEWDLAGATCDSGDINNITINPGDTVTCVFTNSQRARIEVEKVTLPASQADTPFDFTLTGGPPAAPVNLTFPLSATLGQTGSGELRPGVYSLSETVPDGWLQEASCDNNDNPGSINLAAGDTVRCVFTNTQQGRISVSKVTDPADDPASFNINIYGPGGALNETLSVSAATSPRLSNYLNPGFTYSITESLQYPNWSLTGAACDTGTPGAIPIGPGEVINCVFTNTKKAAIVVDKVTDPANDPTSFNFIISPTTGITYTFSLADGTAPHTASYLPPGGPYVVTETTIPPNWNLTGMTCDGLPANEFMLDPGQTATCIFTNTAQPGRILVDKVTLPASEASTGFNFTRSGGPAGTPSVPFLLSDASGWYDSGDLKPGVYSVVESSPGVGWHVASSCDNGGSPASISLVAGQTVRCVFTNTQRGRILVDKVTDPAGEATSFNFTLTGNGLNQPFSLTDGSAVYGSGNYLMPGVYTLTEATPAGWNLTGQSCNGGSPAGMALDPGETITCVFTNTAQPGLLTIVKDANDQNRDFQFYIARKPSLAIQHEFTLNDGSPATNSISYTLPHGSYAAIEAAPSDGWSLSDISCVDPSGNSSQEVGLGRANVELAAGEHITCTFINRINLSVGSITIVKSAVPTGTQSFDFTGDLGTFSLSDGGSQLNQHSVLGLPARRYVITETATAGWTLDSVSCTGGVTSRQGTAVVIDLLGSQNVSCTFTNIAQTAPPTSTITIVKSAIPTGPQAFSFTGDLGNFSLSDGGAPASSYQVTGLTPGPYVITETALAGWQVDSISCSGGSWTQAGASAVAITLAGGENVSCTFVNRAVSSGGSTIYLPVVMKEVAAVANLATTLTVDTSVNPPLVTIVIENRGDYPVDEPFWVDFYVNPTMPPSSLTGPDRRWQRVSTMGIAWPVTAPLAANGGSVTLNSAGGFDPVQTNWSTLPSGVYTFYAFVDSYDNNDPEGATYVEVRESNEADNESLVSTVTIAGTGLSFEQQERPDPGRYPPRSEPE